MRFNSQSGSDPLATMLPVGKPFLLSLVIITATMFESFAIFYGAGHLFIAKYQNFTWDFVEMLYWMILG